MGSPFSFSFFVGLKFKALQVWKSNIRFISLFLPFLFLDINCSCGETGIKMFFHFSPSDAEVRRVKRLNFKGHRGQTPYVVSGGAQRCLGAKVTTDGCSLLG